MVKVTYNSICYLVYGVLHHFQQYFTISWRSVLLVEKIGVPGEAWQEIAYVLFKLQIKFFLVWSVVWIASAMCCTNKRSNTTPQHEVIFYRGHRLHNVLIYHMLSCDFDLLLQGQVICNLKRTYAISWHASPGTPVFSTNKTDRHDILKYCWKWC
jgi:hypothetical protein